MKTTLSYERPPSGAPMVWPRRYLMGMAVLASCHFALSVAFGLIYYDDWVKQSNAIFYRWPANWQSEFMQVFELPMSGALVADHSMLDGMVWYFVFATANAIIWGIILGTLLVVLLHGGSFAATWLFGDGS